MKDTASNLNSAINFLRAALITAHREGAPGIEEIQDAIEDTETAIVWLGSESTTEPQHAPARG